MKPLRRPYNFIFFFSIGLLKVQLCVCNGYLYILNIFFKNFNHCICIELQVKPISESNPVKRRSATTKRVNTKTLETNEAARKAREEARRKMMEERRRAMKQHKPAESIEIFVPQENGK